MAFTETWLTAEDTDCDLTISFGAPIRWDRGAYTTGKSQGGGVCLYVNQWWYTIIPVRETMCTADIELLSMSVRPSYLPCEFPQIFNTIYKVTQKLQSMCPNAPSLILGGFNHCNLKSMSSALQYNTCPTRHEKTLDLCYGSVKGAYICL